MSAATALLADGRLHLQHGPIDCICRAWGKGGEVHAAYQQAAAFFASVLETLCAELPLLRAPLPAARPRGAIAAAMHDACTPFADRFITPMAAVAGAVADAVLAAMLQDRTIARAFVNNGGDIAFHLAPGATLRCGLISDLTSTHLNGLRPTTPSLGHPNGPLPPASGPAHLSGPRPTAPSLDGTFLLHAVSPARGIATSGRACKTRGGKSFSLGIADSVTVLARTAAAADAAATILGNAVDLPGHPAIIRRPATDIDPASDLGDRMITLDVGDLPDDAIQIALDAGDQTAAALLRQGLITGAVLALRGQFRVHHAPLGIQEAA